MTTGVRIVLLAAGRSSRTGASHKLLSSFEGLPLLRRSAETALAADADGVAVVVGYRSDDMRAALEGLPVRIIENANYAKGLATSLIAGFEAASRDAAGVLVMLADQPLLAAVDLNRLIAAFSPEGRGSLVVATDGGRRFNPVIISKIFGGAIRELAGDVGARSILARHPAAVREVEIGRAARLDVDRIRDIVAAGGTPETR